jgi:hypothetical protein
MESIFASGLVVLLVLFSLTMLGSVIIVFVKHRDFGLGGFTLTFFSISILIGMSFLVPSARDLFQKNFLGCLLILGAILSLLMVGSAMMTFIRERQFGWGGFTLTFFGVLLLSLPIIGASTFNTQQQFVNVLSKDIRSYSRELAGASEADLNGKIAQLERKLNMTNDLLKGKYPDLNLSSQSGDKRNSDADFQKNSEYAILTFYGIGNEKRADEIEKALLASGYRASSISSDFLSTSKELPPGTVQVLHATRGKEKLEDIRGIMQNLPDIGKALNVKSEASPLSQGDLRIRIFGNELK